MSDEFVRILPYSVDLSKPIENTELHELFVMGDSLAHRFELEITRGGAPVSLSSSTVTGFFTNFSENTTIKVNGKVKNGKAAVTLSKLCYTLHGQFVLTIQITGGGVDASVFVGDGFMRQTKTETIIYDDYVIYDVSTLLTQIGAMKTATKDAQDAASAASTAATNADEKAKEADTAAKGASGWANATMTATALASGSTPTATVTTASDGHKVITLGIPRGNTGATPQISVQVATGAAGSEASVSVTGTAENPVIHLTIPRGDTGNIGSLKINGKTPDASGTVTLEMSDISGLSEAIANAGGVKTVAGVSPDGTGNVALTAANVGALAKGGTASDSSKLGGKTWAERLLDIYPIGSIYMSVNSTSPASLFGGEWTQINGRFLIGTGAPELNDDGTSPGSYNFAAGSKGGEANHTLTKLEMPTHYHNAYYLGLGGSSTTPAYYATLNKDSYTYNYENTTPNTETVATTTREGSGVAHNNMPPYIAVYIWKRVS